MNELTDVGEVLNLIKQATLVVGMHPDQAAAEIAAYATSAGIPWAIVPCCVYSAQFPKRKLGDGTPVKSIDHFIAWLCELYPKARSTKLGFEGKNICVYVLPEDIDPSVSTQL